MGEPVGGPAQALQQLRLTLSGPRSSSASLTIRLDPLQPTKPRQASCVSPPPFREPSKVLSWAPGSPLQAGSSPAGSGEPSPRCCVVGLALAADSWAASVPTLSVFDAAVVSGTTIKGLVCVRESFGLARDGEEAGTKPPLRQLRPGSGRRACLATQSQHPGVTLSWEQGDPWWARRCGCWAPHTHARACEHAWAQGGFPPDNGKLV